MIHAVLYFYPDGAFAGVLGFYGSLEKANAAIYAASFEYSDCSFIVSEGELQ